MVKDDDRIHLEIIITNNFQFYMDIVYFVKNKNNNQWTEYDFALEKLAHLLSFIYISVKKLNSN
mgnify:CR=1 FL=1